MSNRPRHLGAVVALATLSLIWGYNLLALIAYLSARGAARR